jgi:diacylglycerol kinase
MIFKLKCLGNGIKIAWKQKVFRIWLAICTIGIILGIVVDVGMTQLVLLVAIACLGLGMEVANTSIEVLMDIVHPAYSEKVKIVKDCFSAVPIFVYSAYVISWLILVAPTIYLRLFN